VLIGKYFCEKNNLPEEQMLNTEYITEASGVPRTIFTHDGSSLQMAKSYKELSSDKSRYKQNKVLLLIRDVRDTLVSAYFQATKRIKIYNGPIADFIRDDRFGAKKILKFYGDWYDNRCVPKDLLLVHYERMQGNTELILSQVLSFLETHEIEQDILQNAVKFSSFNNLKRMELSNYFTSKMLSPGDVNDPESFKIRKGQIGGYLEYFDAEDIKYIDDLIDEMGCEFTNVTH
jgi:hypothetical protein